MEIKIILGILATILAFVAYVPIYYGIFFGTVRPHIYTYIVWVVTGSVAYTASLISGGAAGAWSLGFTTLLVIGIALLCFRYGTKDITKSDKLVLALAILSVIPWILTKDPLISVILVTFIESFAFLPTVRKTWNDPHSEYYWPWIINIAKHSLIILAVGSYSITTVLYPAFFVLVNIILAAVIIVRRKMLENSDKKL